MYFSTILFTHLKIRKTLLMKYVVSRYQHQYKKGDQEYNRCPRNQNIEDVHVHIAYVKYDIGLYNNCCEEIAKNFGR
jgi:hypothetical protein